MKANREINRAAWRISRTKAYGGTHVKAAVDIERMLAAGVLKAEELPDLTPEIVLQFLRENDADFS